MKKLLPRVCLTLAIVLVTTSLGALPATHANQATAQEQALNFIENALPVNLSKYNLTFVKYSTIDGEIGDLKYILSSEEGTVDVLCKVEQNVLTNCHIYPMNGPVFRDRQYANLLDAVKSFLEKYKTYSKIDSTNLTAMLNNIDLTKNTTTTANDIKLTITNNFWMGEDHTYFNWAYTVNGADYSLLQLGFLKDGSFEAFLDNRAVYTFSDTSVNFSREQAIEIALGNLSSYSYKMPDQSTISDFNVTKEKIFAELAVSRANYEFRPYWDIRMPLNQTYPGSVQGISVFIWANSGEIISYGNIAFGGIEYSNNSNPKPSLSPTLFPSPSIPEFPVGAVFLLLSSALVALLVFKKRINPN
jgi:hypothetical protein